MKRNLLGLLFQVFLWTVLIVLIATVLIGIYGLYGWIPLFALVYIIVFASYLNLYPHEFTSRISL